MSERIVVDFGREEFAQGVVDQRMLVAFFAFVRPKICCLLENFILRTKIFL